MVMCPLLSDQINYVPDLIDLTKDEEARSYWLNCFEKTIETVKNTRFLMFYSYLFSTINII
jgi:hypothetical protein